uniref:hypothetical protein n=1 Tax=Methylobacterium sp. B34 TaxID=95563 RepID=UPI000349EA54|nr:hypothetical protein [Methylobacterium sp. B34]
MIPKDLSDIKYAVGRIEATVTALQVADATAQANADHRHRNVMQAIETFVPRRELEIEFGKCADRAEHLSKRIDDLEADRKKVLWGVASAWFGPVAAAIIYVIKNFKIF